MEEKEAVIRKMIVQGFSMDEVITATGLSEEEVKKIVGAPEKREQVAEATEEPGNAKGVVWIVLGFFAVVFAIIFGLAAINEELAATVVGAIFSWVLVSMAYTAVVSSIMWLLGRAVYFSRILHRFQIWQGIYFLFWWLTVPENAKELIVDLVFDPVKSTLVDLYVVYGVQMIGSTPPYPSDFPFHQAQIDLVWFVLVPQAIIFLLVLVSTIRWDEDFEAEEQPEQS